MQRERKQSPVPGKFPRMGDTEIMPVFKRLKNASLSMKATLAFGIASFAVSGINYITTPIFTRILSTADYGVITVYNSWYEIIRVFATMTLIFPGILQVGLHEHKENRWKYLSSAAGLITVTTALIAGIYLCFHRPIESFLKLGPSLIVLMLLACVFQSATTLWTTKQRYEYNYKITIIVTIGSAVFAQICAIIAVLLLRDNPDVDPAVVRLWAAGAVNITVGAVLFTIIMAKGKRPVDLRLWGATSLVALPLIPHYLSAVVLHTTDKIMIRHMIGLEEAGIYGLAATLSSLGVLFWRALSTTFSPFVNTKLSERKFREINDVVLPLLTVVGITCVLGALAAPEIIRILATKDYLTGIYVIPPVVVGIFLHAMYDVFSAVAFFHKKSTRIMIASVTAAVVNIVLNYFCILRFGFIAAGYTTMISNLLLTTMHYLNLRKIEPEKIYDLRYLLILTGIVTAACMACNFLYPLGGWIRYVLILGVLVFLFLIRKKVIAAINHMKV